MNKTYKIVFNKTTGVFTAVAEFARSHTKATTVSATVPVTGSAFSLSLIALALMGTIASTSVEAATANTYFHVNATGQKQVGNDTNLDAVDGIGGAKGINSLAAGVNAQAKGLNSVALGHGAKADSDGSVALGNGSQTLENGGVAIGGATARGVETIAIGDLSQAAEQQSVAVGFWSEALNHQALALGSHAKAYESGSTAIGFASESYAVSATALGVGAIANHEKSVALGAVSQTQEAVATSSATVNGVTYAGFAGNEPVATVSVGSDDMKRTITNVAAGRITEDSTDAINGSQLYMVAKGLAKQNYFHVNATGQDQTGNNTNLDTVDGIGGAKGANSIAIGKNAQSTAKGAIAIGKDVVSSSSNGVVIGNNAKTLALPDGRNQDAVVVGVNSEANGIDSTTIGSDAGVDSMGMRNTFVGAHSGRNVQGGENIAMGFQSLENTASSENIAIGLWALRNSKDATDSVAELGSVWGSGHNVAVGTGALNGISGASNTAIGSNAGRFTTGNGNFFAGLLAGGGAGDLEDTVVIGNSAALGGGNYTNSVLVGNYANGGLKGNHIQVVALGNNTQAIKDYSVALGALSVADRVALTAGAAAISNASLANKSVYALEAATAADKKAISATVKGNLSAVSVGNNSNTRQIINVAAGTEDSDAVNVSQLKAVANAAKTEIQNVGFNLTTSASVGTVSGTTFEKIGTGETVTLDAGQNIQLTQAGNKITVATKDDVSFKNVNVTDTLTVGPVTINQTGKITGVTDGDISPTSTDAVNGSQLYAVKQEINNTLSNIKDTSASVTAGSDALTVTKGDTTKVGAADVTDYQVDLSQTTKDDIKKGVDAHDTVTNKGLTFAGDSGKTASQKLGSTVNVKGDKNIKTSASGNTVNVALNDNIDVKSVKAGDTTVNNNGVTINNGAKGSPVSLTKNGLNNGGNRITNVARGVDGTDAVNVSQLKDEVANVDNKINRNSREARAGIAGSNAAAALPQVYIPGKSMVAAAAGTFKGENALAVGYSRSSDNGKLILKLQGNANSRGDIGGGVGVGYQW